MRRYPSQKLTVKRSALKLDPLTMLGLLTSLAFLVLGGAIFARHEAACAAHQDLSAHARVDQSISEPSTDDVTDSPIDWDYLRSVNPEVVAWVRVANTSIDLPVMAAPATDPEFYLSHDFWKERSIEGTPFLDHRSQADGIHRLTFGHHLTMGGQFSDLQNAWDKSRFEGIGTCQWITPTGGVCELIPFCALKANMWEDVIQRFSFDDRHDLCAWLETLAAQATAANQSCRDITTRASSVVTLVTCASDLAGQSERTLVVFVEAATL